MTVSDIAGNIIFAYHWHFIALVLVLEFHIRFDRKQNRIIDHNYTQEKNLLNECDHTIRHRAVQIRCA